MRPAVWKAQKFRGRTKLPCRYCGRMLTREEATVDHVRPRSKGGSNKPQNFRIACAPCNKDKSDKWGEPESSDTFAPDPWWPSRKLKLGTAFRSSGTKTVPK
jgi:5-methylcytosine-specific restriction endonuclease McrA